VICAALESRIIAYEISSIVGIASGMGTLIYNVTAVYGELGVEAE
jgi:hypothetical protein